MTRNTHDASDALPMPVPRGRPLMAIYQLQIQHVGSTTNLWVRGRATVQVGSWQRRPVLAPALALLPCHRPKMLPMTSSRTTKPASSISPLICLHASCSCWPGYKTQPTVPANEGNRRVSGQHTQHVSSADCAVCEAEMSSDTAPGSTHCRASTSCGVNTWRVTLGAGVSENAASSLICGAAAAQAFSFLLAEHAFTARG